MKRALTIEPTRGVSGVRFGASPDDTREALGSPDEEEVRLEQDRMIWHYRDPDVSLVFDTVTAFQLVSCQTRDLRALLGGQALVGLKLLDALELLRRAGFHNVHVQPVGDQPLVPSKARECDLWVQDDHVKAVSWSMLA